MTGNKMPRHVAIVMDGNGRWAARRGVARAMGHRRGVEALRGVVRESSDRGIDVLSLYAFSTENWKRSTEEVGVLMGLLLEFFDRETEALHRNHVNIRVIGDTEGLPGLQREAALRAMARTRGNGGLQLNVALNYGGRDELVRAFRAIASHVAAGRVTPGRIDAEMIANALDTAGQPDVDLMIRPGGELRLSNFLLYQSAYAEFMFPDVLWPDFTVDIYREMLNRYALRDRRFGGRGGEG